WGQAWDESFEYYRQDKRGVLGCFALSVLTGALTFCAFEVAARLLGESVPLGDTFLVGPLILLANCLPLTPGGLGVAETASHGLYAALGTMAGGEMMALVRVTSVLVSVPGAFFLASCAIGPRGAPAQKQSACV